MQSWPPCGALIIEKQGEHQADLGAPPNPHSLAVQRVGGADVRCKQKDEAMATDVFISVGRPCTPNQEAFIVAIEDLLRTNGFSPRAVGRSDFSSKQPLKFVQELMNRCRGTVIIAFERLYVTEGEEKRGSADCKLVKHEIMPTVWNQIEAAMAYVLNQPLLVIVEEGSRTEGLLEAGYDWYVLKVEIEPSSVNGREFQGVFADWARRVRDHDIAERKKRTELPPEFDFSRIKIHQFFALMTPGQLWKFGAAIAAIVAAAYSLGRYFSHIFTP